MTSTEEYYCPSTKPCDDTCASYHVLSDLPSMYLRWAYDDYMSQISTQPIFLLPQEQ